MSPERQGPLGALMDEYERAAAEFALLIDSLSDEEIAAVRDPAAVEGDSRTIFDVLGHVVRAGFGYANLIREAFGGEREKRTKPTTRTEWLREFHTMLEESAALLDPRGAMTWEETFAITIPAPWGVVYNLEQLLEHAIVHVLRHRRQIERWLARARQEIEELG